MSTLYNKTMIFALIVIFVLWLFLQISLNMSIVKNPLNYFVVFTIFFFILNYAMNRRAK
ncbi:membrane protein [Pontibacillus halophilus JSM 076056 = DSM 19796]|uniref:Membrane protein n=1 Tax=Pontibacillus halophilus JSM 076056 = DSM 19796 TaxID=1385510 RepID=A0A0A5I2B1_9BACI|nr:hypothetical protein [Pontibacillus halophilus]KGX89977.1 membrane protein [Pontibacillus halophilus JSM 076056 = DSM 19796]